MNEMNSISVSALIRNRRRMLRIKQAGVAEEMRVSEPVISHWECGRRRVELNKLPRLATLLKLDPKELCRLALFEWHPRFYNALFGSASPRLLDQVKTNNGSAPLALPAGSTDHRLLEIGVVVGDALRQAEQLA